MTNGGAPGGGKRKKQGKNGKNKRKKQNATAREDKTPGREGLPLFLAVVFSIEYGAGVLSYWSSSAGTRTPTLLRPSVVGYQAATPS
jgi:hypothetical protein